MPQTARTQLEVVTSGTRHRGEHPRPVGVQLAVGVAKHVTANDDDRGISIVVVFPGTRRPSRPGRIVLAAVNLDEDVRRDLAVEPADARNDRLRNPGDASVPDPQPHERLAVRIVQCTHHPAPSTDPRRGAGEHGIHPLRRPLLVPGDGGAAGDRDIPALARKDENERIVKGDSPG